MSPLLRPTNCLFLIAPHEDDHRPPTHRDGSDTSEHVWNRYRRFLCGTSVGNKVAKEIDGKLHVVLPTNRDALKRLFGRKHYYLSLTVHSFSDEWDVALQFAFVMELIIVLVNKCVIVSLHEDGYALSYFQVARVAQSDLLDVVEVAVGCEYGGNGRRAAMASDEVRPINDAFMDHLDVKGGEKLVDVVKHH